MGVAEHAEEMQVATGGPWVAEQYSVGAGQAVRDSQFEEKHSCCGLVSHLKVHSLASSVNVQRTQGRHPTIGR